jgi:hypothetical protein
VASVALVVVWASERAEMPPGSGAAEEPAAAVVGAGVSGEATEGPAGAAVGAGVAGQEAEEPAVEGPGADADADAAFGDGVDWVAGVADALSWEVAAAGGSGGVPAAVAV